MLKLDLVKNLTLGCRDIEITQIKIVHAKVNCTLNLICFNYNSSSFRAIEKNKIELEIFSFITLAISIGSELIPNTWLNPDWIRR